MDAPLTWEAGDNLQVAFSTAADGDQREDGPRAAFLARLGLAGCRTPWQEHGVRIADADDPCDLARRADGVVSTDLATPLGVTGADCPGLILDAGTAWGAAHCGWRGVAGGIVAALVAALAPRTRRPPSAWRAFIGPGISAAHFEVDAPVLNARAWPAGCLRPGRPGHAFLDLPAAIAADLAATGVGEVRRCGVCTWSDRRLHSYRRDGKGGVQVLVAWRTTARP